MANVDAWRSGAIEFVQTPSRLRAASYHERAAHLTAIAAAEPDQKLRAQFVDLVKQYEEMAAALDKPALDT